MAFVNDDMRCGSDLWKWRQEREADVFDRDLSPADYDAQDCPSTELSCSVGLLFRPNP